MPLAMTHLLRSLPFLLAALPALAQNQALQLTIGVDGGVEYPFDARMVPPTGITVEAWITYDDSTIPVGSLFYWPTIARQNINPNQESWNFRVSAGNNGARNLQFIVRASNNSLYSAGYQFAPGEFTNATHVAATWDGQVIRIYKSAVQVATYTLPLLSEVQNNAGLLRLGNGDPVAPGREAWNGTIDEVRIWPMARDATEIAATQNQQLSGMTADVLAFPLNGTYDSTDGTVLGTPFGTSGFVAAGAVLTPVIGQVFNLGVPSSTCARKPGMVAGSAPLLGNSAFTMWCVRGPRPAVAPAGALFAALNQAPPAQPSVLGLQVAWDLTTLITSVAFAPVTDALGNAKATLPIPQQPALIGAGWVFQWAFLDNQCGAQGFTSSDGMVFAIQ